MTSVSCSYIPRLGDLPSVPPKYIGRNFFICQKHGKWDVIFLQENPHSSSLPFFNAQLSSEIATFLLTSTTR